MSRGRPLARRLPAPAAPNGLSTAQRVTSEICRERFIGPPSGAFTLPGVRHAPDTGESKGSAKLHAVRAAVHR